MKNIFRRIHAHRDAVLFVVTVVAALVAVQINDERGESAIQIAEVQK